MPKLEILLPKHPSQLSYRTITIIRFATPSCKTQKYCACSSSSEEPGRNHSTAIYRRSIAKHKRLATHYCTPFAWMQQFQCTVCLNTCKTQKHSINKEQKRSPGTISCTARAVRERFHGKAATPEAIAQAGQLFSAEPPRFPPQKKNNVSCKSYSSIQIASMMSQFQCDLPTMTCKTHNQDQNANQNAVLQNKYPSRSLGAANKPCHAIYRH